ncbi:hypothetical protein ACLOJK_003707 [Asimina triloba]
MGKPYAAYHSSTPKTHYHLLETHLPSLVQALFRLSHIWRTVEINSPKSNGNHAWSDRLQIGERSSRNPHVTEKQQGEMPAAHHFPTDPSHSDVVDMWARPCRFPALHPPEKTTTFYTYDVSDADSSSASLLLPTPVRARHAPSDSPACWAPHLTVYPPL